MQCWMGFEAKHIQLKIINIVYTYLIRRIPCRDMELKIAIYNNDSVINKNFHTVLKINLIIKVECDQNELICIHSVK